MVTDGVLRHNGVAPVTVNVLCVPGPSGDPAQSGLGYFEEAFRRLVTASKGIQLNAFVASFPEHRIPVVLGEIGGIAISHTVVERESIGLASNQMSAEHGTLLNLLIAQSKRVSADYTVILDSDFFLLQNVELADVLSQMKAEGLDLVGVPFPPERIHQPWNFPAPFFQIWKFDSLYSRQVDFRPRWAIGETRPERKRITRSGLDQRLLASLVPLVKGLAALVGSDSENRLAPRDFIGDAMFWKLGSKTYNSDTGCLVYEELAPLLTTRVMKLSVHDDSEAPHLQGFNVAEYVRVNPDVPVAAATWHVRNIGFPSGRRIGRQSLMWLLVSMMVRNRWRQRSDQPFTHLLWMPTLGRLVSRGDLYLENGEAFGLHLGSRGKSGYPDDVEYVLQLESALAEVSISNDDAEPWL